MNNLNSGENKHHFDYGVDHLEGELKHDHKETDQEINLFRHKIAPVFILIATLLLTIAFILFFSNSSPTGQTNKERINELLNKNISNQSFENK